VSWRQCKFCLAESQFLAHHDPFHMLRPPEFHELNSFSGFCSPDALGFMGITLMDSPGPAPPEKAKRGSRLNFS
jgi:hypothetical protein